MADALDQIPKPSKIEKSKYLDKGSLPIVDQGEGIVGGYTNDSSLAYQGKLPVIVFGDHTCRLKYVSFPFVAGADGTQVIRPKHDWLPRYFYYCLLATDLKHFGYQRHFKLLKEKLVPHRPIPVQRKISTVLAAYDELIDNNRQRIELLEEMAQAVYRESFSSREWRLGPVGGLGEVMTGTTPQLSRPELFGNKAPFITPSDLAGSRFVRTARGISSEALRVFERRLVPEGAVCFTCIGSVGKMCMTDKTSLTNQQINSVVASTPALSLFAYQHLKHHALLIGSYAGGVATPIISKSVFSAIEIPMPPKDLQEAFGKTVSPFDAMVRLLNELNSNLRSTRDLLLPKLISGDLDVSDLDIDTDWLVA